MDIGINTENFYKFICTLSLALTVYCFSFDSIFLEPYNVKAAELNVQKGELAADMGYLKGKSADLRNLVRDTSQCIIYSYFVFNHSKDTSEEVNYYSNPMLRDSARIFLDSLNKINSEYAKATFKYHAIVEFSDAIHTNIIIKTWIFRILGIMSLLAFIISLAIWYQKRNHIDK